MTSTPATFYTIGHSNRPLEEFLRLLAAVEIATVVDVRKIPQSRAHPQFGRPALEASLTAAGRGYVHMPVLGGRRGVLREVAPELNGWWKIASFHNFADYALTAEFRDGLAQLQALGHAARCALMCSEAVWWRCHRRIIADHLLNEGECVVHILGAGRQEPASLSDGARRDSHGRLTYPALV